MVTTDIKEISKTQMNLLGRACLILKKLSFKKIAQYSCYRSIKSINNILLKNSQLLFNDYSDHKKRFFELINDKSKLCQFPFTVKEILIKSLPYIIQIYEDELNLIGKKINYVELYTKIRHLNVKLERERNIRTIIADGVEYVSCNNKKDLLNIHSLKCSLNFTHISDFERYWRFIHELFQIIQLKIETQQRKRGLCYYDNGETIFEPFDEGNTERMTRAVIKRMIIDGHIMDEFKNFEKYRVYKYKIAEKIVTRMINVYSGMCNAIHGELSDLLEFEKYYSSNNKTSLKELEKKISNENYNDYISKLTAPIIVKYFDKFS